MINQNNQNFIYDQNNVFYKILNKQIPSEIIMENDDFIAIHDIYPQAQNHILCISKGYYINLTHMITEKPELMQSLSTFILDITNHFNIKNYRIVMNSAIEGEFKMEVFHFHAHILSDDANSISPYYKIKNNDKHESLNFT